MIRYDSSKKKKKKKKKNQKYTCIVKIGKSEKVKLFQNFLVRQQLQIFHGRVHNVVLAFPWLYFHLRSIIVWAVFLYDSKCVIIP